MPSTSADLRKQTIETALADIRALVQEVAPAHAGLRDLSKLKFTSETAAEIRKALEAYDHLASALKACENAATFLLAVGYPEAPTQAVSPEALQEIRGQVETLEAAGRRFHPHEAISGVVTFGPPHT